MFTFFHRFGKLLALLAAVQILGGHWAVLQGLAWSRMFFDNARRDSLRIAVAKTFDGAHPCALCRRVSAGRQQEQKQERAEITLVKVEAILAPPLEIPVPPLSTQYSVTPVLSAASRPHSPPTPPPKFA